MPILKRYHLAAWLAAASLFGPLSTASAHHDRVGEEVAAGILGLAVGAAIASGGERHHDVYEPPREPVRVGPAPFSPERHVTCYPAQSACYYNDGAYSVDWTHRIYGYR